MGDQRFPESALAHSATSSAANRSSSIASTVARELRPVGTELIVSLRIGNAAPHLGRPDRSSPFRIQQIAQRVADQSRR